MPRRTNRLNVPADAVGQLVVTTDHVTVRVTSARAGAALAGLWPKPVKTRAMLTYRWTADEAPMPAILEVLDADRRAARAAASATGVMRGERERRLYLSFRDKYLGVPRPADKHELRKWQLVNAVDQGATEAILRVVEELAAIDDQLEAGESVRYDDEVERTLDRFCIDDLL